MDNNKEEILAEVQPKVNEISVVFPYMRTLCSPISLKCAIQSLTNLLGVIPKVVVIGDGEDWYTEDIMHVNWSLSPDDRINCTSSAALMACSIEEISDQFILMPPDTFILNRLTLPYIEVPKVDLSGLYGCGLPVVIDKFRFTTMAELYAKKGLDITIHHYVLDCNSMPLVVDWKKDNWVLPLVSKQPDAQKFEALLSQRLFLRVHPDAWSAWLENRLLDFFMGVDEA